MQAECTVLSPVVIRQQCKAIRRVESERVEDFASDFARFAFECLRHVEVAHRASGGGDGDVELHHHAVVLEFFLQKFVDVRFEERFNVEEKDGWSEELQIGLEVFGFH